MNMWYIVLFVTGLSAGVILISIFASATIDRLRWENKYLRSQLNKVQPQLGRKYEMPINQPQEVELHSAAEKENELAAA